MDGLRCYKTMPEWHAQTLPEAFQRRHNTKAGTWARLTLLEGELDFAYMDEAGNETSVHHFDVAHQPPLIEPQQWHRIAGFSSDVRCQLAFLCEPADYFARKYGLTPTHSEVLEAAPQLTPGRVLDLGCGNGRNTLHLAALGHEVDAWDRNTESLAKLRHIIEAEKLSGVSLREVDLNAVDIAGSYDFILSTVVLMFLQPETVPRLVRQMQNATVPGGHNLIVAAMDTPDYPCSVSFPFTFRPGELRDAYDGWDILKYNENPGTLHRTDEHGNRIALQFATLLARRPA